MPARGDEEPLVTYLAANTLRLRKAREWTQADLAALLDVDDRYVRRIESGRVNITLVMLGKLARAFEVTPGQLLRRARLPDRKPGRPKGTKASKKRRS